MRIALDATPLTSGSGGIFRYTAELLRALAVDYPNDEFLPLSDQPGAGLPPLAPPRLRRRWWLAGLPWELRRRECALFHGTNFEVPYLPTRPSVLTLHDLSPWRNPEWRHGAHRVRRRAPVLLRMGIATMVITPTEAIRRESIDRFRLDPGRVVAVHHGASADFHPVPVADSGAYFLFVSTLGPRKNVGMALRAWRDVWRTHGIPFKIVGRLRADSPEIASEPGLHFLGDLPDRDLPGLYSGALALVYPSDYEGFGLPLLEAMQCGCPVLASRDPALLEVSGSAAIHVDSEKSLAEAMRALASNPEFAGRVRDLGLRRAADFSWSRAARETMAVYVEAQRRF